MISSQFNIDLISKILNLSFFRLIKQFKFQNYEQTYLTTLDKDNTNKIMGAVCFVDMCPNPNVSSDNFHWTQALPQNHNDQVCQHINILYGYG